MHAAVRNLLEQVVVIHEDMTVDTLDFHGQEKMLVGCWMLLVGTAAQCTPKIYYEAHKISSF